jgi:hypothetical protein
MGPDSHTPTEYFEFWVGASQRLFPSIFGQMVTYCIEHECHWVPTSISDEYARKAFYQLIKNGQRPTPLLRSIFGSVEIDADQDVQSAFMQMFARAKVMMRALTRSFYYYRSRSIIHVRSSVIEVLTKNVDSDLKLPVDALQAIPFGGCVYAFDEAQHWHKDRSVITKGFLLGWCPELKGLALMLFLEDVEHRALVPMQIRIPIQETVQETIDAMADQVILSISNSATELAHKYDIRSSDYLSKLLALVLFSISEDTLTPWPDNKSKPLRRRNVVIEQRTQNYWLGRELMCALQAETEQYEREHKGKAIHWRRGYYGLRHKTTGTALVLVRPCIVGLKVRAEREL